MGSALMIRVIEDMPEAELKTTVERQRAEDAFEDGHRYSGSWGAKHGLIVSSTTFPSIEAAEAHVEQHSDKHQPILAVRARTLSKDAQKSAALMALELKCRQAEQQVFAFPPTVIQRVAQGKSKTKGCPTCGSAIAVAHIRSVTCPVCRAEFLYSATDKKRVQALREKSENLKAQLKVAQAKELETLERRGVSTTVWVVGGWCSS